MSELYAGANVDMSGSMAEAMLQAMDEVLAESGRPPMTDSSRPGMQVMFLAISRGVLRHLKVNEQALHIDLPQTGQRVPVTIDTRG
jgi:monoamine oxidase